MRFRRVLHPEVILNRRGPENVRGFYKNVMSTMTMINGSVMFQRARCKSFEQFLAVKTLLDADDNIKRHMAQCVMFREGGGRCYHIGMDFIRALSKIDREVPVDVIPEEFIGYFSFAEGSIADEDGEVQGGYVWISRAKDKFGGLEPGTRFISMSYVNTKVVQDAYPRASLLVELTQARIDELAASVPLQDVGVPRDVTVEEIKGRENVFRVLLNALVYLFSDGAEIETSRPARETGISNKEMMRRGQVINECTVPVFFLNRKYVSHRIRHVDATWIEPHFRWQRCGVGLSAVRLTLVTGHERRYVDA